MCVNVDQYNWLCTPTLFIPVHYLATISCPTQQRWKLITFGNFS
jgi:hypothetical protein